MADDKTRSLVCSAIASRGAIYVDLLTSLEKRLGRQEAEEVFREALRIRGASGARAYSEAVQQGDLEALAKEFVDRRSGDADAFCRSADAPDGDELRIRLGACPLVDAWKSLGLSNDECDRMCLVANAVDYGKFEDGFGLRLEFEGRIASGDPECVLHLHKRKVKK